METLTITLDERTQTQLRTISDGEGVAPSDMAARLLRRAVRASRPRPVWDTEAIRRNALAFADEDLALAESDISHRADLLAQEDAG